MQNTKKDQNTDDRRLWIGNLDTRITEYQLLKLVQKHGAIEKFDLLFHRAGPLAGQPRGYAFVTYLDQSDAIQAKDFLNGVLVGQKKITVMWAHSMSNEDFEKQKPDIHIPALAMSKSERKTDRESQIQAIEAKLKLMEKKSEDELCINETVASKLPVIPQFQQSKLGVASSVKSRSFLKKQDKSHKPYSKHKSH